MAEEQRGEAESPKGELTLGRIPRRVGEELRILRTTYAGRQWVDIRLWFERVPGDWCPTKKGITVRAEDAARLAQILGDAVAMLERGRNAEGGPLG